MGLYAAKWCDTEKEYKKNTKNRKNKLLFGNAYARMLSGRFWESPQICVYSQKERRIYCEGKIIS